VVFHDDLVTPEILKLISPAAEVQNVGKRCGSKTIRQEEINFLMVTRACRRTGSGAAEERRPVDLRGGLGKRSKRFDDRNIEYEIVPGVTSAFGAAAAAGDPVNTSASIFDFLC